MKTVSALLALLLSLSLACRSTESSSKPQSSAPAQASVHQPSLYAGGVQPGVVDGEQARKLVQAGVHVVDVRTPEEFGSGHVPGAVNIPFDQMPARYAELGPPTTPVLVYCKSGRRSAKAIETLRANGFTEIYDLKSYDRWASTGSEPTGKAPAAKPAPGAAPVTP